MVLIGTQHNAQQIRADSRVDKEIRVKVPVTLFRTELLMRKLPGFESQSAQFFAGRQPASDPLSDGWFRATLVCLPHLSEGAGTMTGAMGLFSRRYSSV